MCSSKSKHIIVTNSQNYATVTHVNEIAEMMYKCPSQQCIGLIMKSLKPITSQ
jgi:hypothetical protein